MRAKTGITLIVLAIAALFATVIVQDVLIARNRSRQKRTMADIASIATAWEARATTINSYAVGSARGRVSAGDLARALEPAYIRKFPRNDGWGTEFQFSTNGDAQTYVIRSLAGDRRIDRDLSLSGATTDFSDDIVYSNGAFVRFPESAG